MKKELFIKDFNGEKVFSLEYDKETLKDMVIEKQQEIERLNNIIKIMENYLELIYDLGYDYDGLTEVGDLQDLINELCRYASLGRAYNITETIYENNGKKYNILHKELKENK